MFDLESVKELFKTEPNIAFFWSGLGKNGAEIAKEVAKSNGGVTLEMLMEHHCKNTPIAKTHSTGCSGVPVYSYYTIFCRKNQVVSCIFCAFSHHSTYCTIWIFAFLTI